MAVNFFGWMRGGWRSYRAARRHNASRIQVAKHYSEVHLGCLSVFGHNDLFALASQLNDIPNSDATAILQAFRGPTNLGVVRLNHSQQGQGNQ